MEPTTQLYELNAGGHQEFVLADGNNRIISPEGELSHLVLAERGPAGIALAPTGTHNPDTVVSIVPFYDEGKTVFDEPTITGRVVKASEIDEATANGIIGRQRWLSRNVAQPFAESLSAIAAGFNAPHAEYEVRVGFVGINPGVESGTVELDFNTEATLEHTLYAGQNIAFDADTIQYSDNTGATGEQSAEYLKALNGRSVRNVPIVIVRAYEESLEVNCVASSLDEQSKSPVIVLNSDGESFVGPEGTFKGDNIVVLRGYSKEKSGLNGNFPFSGAVYVHAKKVNGSTTNGEPFYEHKTFDVQTIN